MQTAINDLNLITHQSIFQLKDTAAMAFNNIVYKSAPSLLLPPRLLRGIMYLVWVIQVPGFRGVSLRLTPLKAYG